MTVTRRLQTTEPDHLAEEIIRLAVTLMSAYRESWRRRRIFLFLAGVGLASFLAAVITFVIALGPLDKH